MRLDVLDFDLPPERIAQVPAPTRDAARLLVLDRASGRIEHDTIGGLVSRLGPGDLVVVNDTRVRPARLVARRATGGRVELLAIEAIGDGTDAPWLALARAGGRLVAGEELVVADDVRVRLVAVLAAGRVEIRAIGESMESLLARYGRMPLPPYIRREGVDLDALDRERYQTTFAAQDGAVAAPTAGLHLSPGMFEAIRARGVRIAALTLHVGLGTFEPVRVDDLDDHRMHVERGFVPAETADAVRATRAAGGRVVAVGTTTVRALESAAAASPDGAPRAGDFETALLIQPGYRFRAVDALLTNFHLPRSTLLALVAAFAGTEAVLDAYRAAVAAGYRFFSYGDAMWIA